MSKKAKKVAKKVSKPTPHTRAPRIDMGLDAPVQVNFTQAHREKVRSAANKEGLTLAAYIRNAALKAANLGK